MRGRRAEGGCNKLRGVVFESEDVVVDDGQKLECRSEVKNWPLKLEVPSY